MWRFARTAPNLAADGLLWRNVAHGRKHGLKQLRDSRRVGGRGSGKGNGKRCERSLISTGFVERAAGIVTPTRMGYQQRGFLQHVIHSI